MQFKNWSQGRASCGALSAPLLFAQSIPSVNDQKEFKNGKASLAGEWTPFADIASSKANFKIVQLPNFWVLVLMSLDRLGF